MHLVQTDFYYCLLFDVGYIFISGNFKFVPSRFVRLPKEFRRLYGPNVRQTMIDGYFNKGKCKNLPTAKLLNRKTGNSIRQSKVVEFFKLKRM